jgi:hypothetical protein
MTPDDALVDSIVGSFMGNEHQSVLDTLQRDKGINLLKIFD